MKRKKKNKIINTDKSFQKKVVLGFFVALLILTAVIASGDTILTKLRNNSVEAAEISPIGQTGQWDMVFSDEFDSNVLDLAKWEPSWFGGTSISNPINSDEDACYDPAQVTVTNGKLELTATNSTNPNCKIRNGSQANYASGMVNSRKSFTFTYGYIEARMNLPGENGDIWNWPAFWTDGTGSWPTTGEIDIMESLSTHKPCWHYHYSLNGSHKQVGDCVDWPDATGWHTYGAKWEPNKITYYYDGEEVGTVTEGVVNAPHFIILNNGINDRYGINVPATVEVDFVRVWKENITVPTSTPQPSATNTPVPQATNTPVPKATNTSVPQVTNTPVPSPTEVPDGVTVSSFTLNPSADITSNKKVNASITVTSAETIKVQALTVAVRSTRNKNYDFKGAKTNVVIGPNGYSFTTDSRTFPDGEYTAFVAYKYNNKWYNLAPQVDFTSTKEAKANSWLQERWRRWRRS